MKSRWSSRALRAGGPAMLVASAAAIAVFSFVRPVETHPRITTTIFFNREIKAILQRRCFQCHTPQNNAMSLLSFKDARPWAAAIREEVLERRMPPWSAVAGYGHFQNDASLNQREIDFIAAWADGGAPSGQTPDDERLPVVMQAPAPVWEHGNPEYIYAAAAAVAVPARAADGVARAEVAIDAKMPLHVRGLAYKAGDRRVVRAVVVSEAASGRWLFTWTPWRTDIFLPPGTAVTLAPGSRLRLDIAYRGADADASEQGEVGLYRADGARGEATTETMTSSAAPVPAGAAGHRVRFEKTVTAPGLLAAVWPELPAGTRAFELSAIRADGVVEPLLWLRNVRADWPSPYVLRTPAPLVRDTRLVATAYLDNATNRPADGRVRVSLLRVPPPVPATR